MAGCPLARAQKKALTKGWTIVFVDESCFRLLPSVRKTYAPKGRRPKLKVFLTRDHLSIMGGITFSGRLLFRVQKHSVHQDDVVRFLRHLLSEIAGVILVVWDGASIHTNRRVKQFVAEESEGRLILEQLPPYAPELNPSEGIWNYLKNREMKNQTCSDLEDLRHKLRRAIARLRHKHAVIRGCAIQTRLL